MAKCAPLTQARLSTCCQKALSLTRLLFFKHLQQDFSFEIGFSFHLLFGRIFFLSRGLRVTLEHDSKLAFIYISKQPKLLRLLKTGSSWKEKTHQWAVSFVPVPGAVTSCWQGGVPPGPRGPHGFELILDAASARALSGRSQTPQTPPRAKAAEGALMERERQVKGLLMSLSP